MKRGVPVFEAVTEGQKPLAEKVSDQIVGLITSQNLISGQKLPNEFELANHLQVGRGTVREAVKLLVSRNILEIRRGKGTFVSQDPGLVEDPLGLSFFQDKYKLAMDLIEIRYILEPQITALAARNATAEDIEEMKLICQGIDELAEEGENYTHLDIQLHTRIAQCTKNLVMPNLIPIIDRGIELFNVFPYRVERMEALRVHWEIMNAIEAHDEDAADRAMRKHLSYNKRNMRNLRPMYESELQQQNSQ